MPPFTPYASKKQARWAHTSDGREALGDRDVKGKDQATSFKRLPMRALAKHHSSKRR